MDSGKICSLTSLEIHLFTLKIQNSFSNIKKPSLYSIMQRRFPFISRSYIVLLFSFTASIILKNALQQFVIPSKLFVILLYSYEIAAVRLIDLPLSSQHVWLRRHWYLKERLT